jgi:TatD DNase family protein
MFIDCHCHLDYFNEKELDEIISDCRKKDVKLIITNGTNPKTNRRALEISEEYPEVRLALGLYPLEALGMNWRQVEREFKFIKENSDKLIAIGEIGMDFKDSTEKEKELQKKVFKNILLIARKLDIPVLIHSRKAEEECIKILEKLRIKKVMMHCFSGRKNLITRVVENGWYLSIPTCVTKSEHFQNMIKIVPVDNLLCETDSPFMHPEKSGDNNPSNVVESYKKISEIKSLGLKEVEEKIEKNFEKLFAKG